MDEELPVKLLSELLNSRTPELPNKDTPSLLKKKPTSKENKSYVTTQFNSRLAKHTQIPFTKHNKRARSVGQPAMLQPVHALLPLHHWHRQTF